MELIAKDMNIATGGPVVAILNEEDAEKLDLHSEDRARLKCGRKQAVVILNIAESRKAVAPGSIGLFEEAIDLLGAKHKSKIKIFLEEKPKAVPYIKKKLEGKKLSNKEMTEIIKSISNNKLSAVELTHFVAACYPHGLSTNEVLSMTKAMVLSGDRLKFKGKVMDLHCIGGVPGNRTTMIVVPIVAAAGLQIPKTSSRAITSPSGTADTMEVLAKVDIKLEKLRKVIKKTNGCIVWGGAINLAPADDKIIKVEHPVSIDAEGQLLASVMAKKYSVSANRVLIDIPVGKTTKAPSIHHAKHLKHLFEMIGKKLGMKMKVIITDGSQPIGKGIGSILEARDCMHILKNSNTPSTLKEKSLHMAGLMLEMGEKAKKGKGKLLARQILESGAAYKKMKQIISAQGRKDIKLKPGKYKFDVRAKRNGKIKEMNNIFISKTARIAGAPKDAAAGLYLHKHLGDKVKKGEKIFTVYAENKEKLGYAKNFLKEKTCVTL